MKHTYITTMLAAGFVGLVSLASCSDSYLDKQIDVTENQNAIYSDSAKVAGVINYFYDKLEYSFNYKRFGKCALDLPSLEAETRGAESSMGMRLALNTVNASNADAGIWNDTYTMWRAINIFMNNYNNGTVARIPSSDPNHPDDKLAKSTIEYWKGQAFFCRAWYVFTLIKHYGGIPLIGDKVYDQEETINVPRSTYEESIDYALAQCDSAYTYLMDSGHEFNYSATDPGAGLGNTPEGRACAVMCKALKARIYLYAASPLVNSSRADDPEHLVSYGSEDKNRWQLAYDAAREIIDLSEGSSDYYKLDEGTYDASTTAKAFWPRYYHMFVDGASGSKEAIICFMLKNDWSADAGKRKELDGYYRPQSRPLHGSGSSNTGYPTQELVDAFPMADGFPRGDARSRYTYADGDSMYQHRDPRLRATVSYNGAYRILEGFPNAKMKTYTGDFITEGNDDDKSAYKDGIYQPNATTTGYYRMKMLHDAGNDDNAFRPRFMMRYAEILMIAAEAANELHGPTEECYKYLRMIRKRAEIEKDNKTGANEYGVPDNMTQAEMREFIQRERQIEFAFEEQRYWDIRRWKIAPEVCNTTSHGMEITRHDDGDGKEHFTYRRVEVLKHSWNDRLYWWPIPRTEMVKSDALKQNPGY